LGLCLGRETAPDQSKPWGLSLQDGEARLWRRESDGDPKNTYSRRCHKPFGYRQERDFRDARAAPERCICRAGCPSCSGFHRCARAVTNANARSKSLTALHRVPRSPADHRRQWRPVPWRAALYLGQGQGQPGRRNRDNGALCRCRAQYPAVESRCSRRVGNAAVDLSRQLAIRLQRASPL
jgi:hypothetical protein